DGSLITQPMLLRRPLLHQAAAHNRPKASCGYLSRWDMFVRHGFDPDADLNRNTLGVFEWDRNKAELIREFDLYLHSRNAHANNI
ncbi:MAG TPA: hypothetical protein PLY97_10730, partial [Acidocella sp.]|nr:hypothetical protein [Acidocella sp.]